jgi:Cu/Ag efflux protein CusF
LPTLWDEIRMNSNYQNSLYVVGGVVAAFIIWFAAHSARKVEVKSYPLTGVVREVHLDTHTARIYNDDMPGFMEPMAMDYQVKDAAVLKRLHTGDKIQATLLSDRKDVWQLENVVITSSAQ